MRGEIRVAPPGSSDRIRGFYERYPSQSVLGRPIALKNAIDRGLAVEIVVDHETVAVAMVFVLSTTPLLLEFGGTRVASHWEGRRLQQRLFGARFCAAAKAFGGVDGYRIVTGADPRTSPKSISSIERMGFVRMQRPHALLLAECAACPKAPATGSERPCCCDFYHLPRSELTERIGEFAALENFIVASPDNETEVVIDNHVLTAEAKLEFRTLLGVEEQRIR